MAEQKVKKVPVSARALLQRINRKLAAQNQALHKTRTKYINELGDYHLIDFNRNAIIAQHCDLEKYGRELDVLRDFETLDSE